MTTDKGNTFLEVGKVILYPVIFLSFLVGSTIVHEIGHALAAIIKGVRPSELIIGWYGVGPGVTIPSTFPLDDLPFFRYAGGLIAAFVCIVLYVLFWVYPLQSRASQVRWGGLKWWTGEFLLLWGIFQLVNGYIEGALFERYVAEPGILQVAIFVAIPISLILHAGVTYIRRIIQRSVG